MRYVFTFACSAFLFAVALVWAGTGQVVSGELFKQRDEFAKRAVDRLINEPGLELDFGRKAALKKLFETWKIRKDENSWKALYTDIRRIATQSGVKSNVEIRCVDRGRERTGLLVKYRLDGEQKVWTARQPTRSKEEMTIGLYRIWIETNGKVYTDMKSLYKIVDRSENVTLVIK